MSATPYDATPSPINGLTKFTPLPYSHTILQQTVFPTQKIVVPKPISNAVSMRFELINYAGISTTGTLLWLTCNEDTRSNVQYTSVLGNSTTVCWTEQGTIPANPVDYMKPITQCIVSPMIQDISYFTLQLASDGVITVAGGAYMNWRITFQHAGPDSLLRSTY
jgi:hypothetical protein